MNPKSRNVFVCLAAIAALGYNHQTVGVQGRTGRLARKLGRPVEYKDDAVAALLGEIKAGIQAAGDRIAALEARPVAEVKSADFVGLKADLDGFKSMLTELKSADLGGLKAALTGRIDEVERKINQAVIDSQAAKSGRRKLEQKSIDKITGMMRAGQDVAAEVKSLDQELVSQSIANEETKRPGMGILSRIPMRPSVAANPRVSFPKGGTVVIKGEESGDGDSPRRVKKEGTVKTLEHEGEIDKEDVDDGGPMMLGDELTAAANGAVQKLRHLVIDDVVEANLLDPDDSGFNADNDYALLTTTVAAWTAADILRLIQQVPEQYRDGAAWACAPTMIPTLAAIEDEAGNALFMKDLTGKTPGTLCGYPIQEESDVAAGRLIFGNWADAVAVWERQPMKLDNVRQVKSVYYPYYMGRYAWQVRDCEALAAMDTAAGS